MQDVMKISDESTDKTEIILFLNFNLHFMVSQPPYFPFATRDESRKNALNYFRETTDKWEVYVNPWRQLDVRQPLI